MRLRIELIDMILVMSTILAWSVCTILAWENHPVMRWLFLFNVFLNMVVLYGEVVKK